VKEILTCRKRNNVVDITKDRIATFRNSLIKPYANARLVITQDWEIRKTILGLGFTTLKCTQFDPV
jgi:hypothetical protein